MNYRLIARVMNGVVFIIFRATGMENKWAMNRLSSFRRHSDPLSRQRSWAFIELTPWTCMVAMCQSWSLTLSQPLPLWGLTPGLHARKVASKAAMPQTWAARGTTWFIMAMTHSWGTGLTITWWESTGLSVLPWSSWCRKTGQPCWF